MKRILAMLLLFLSVCPAADAWTPPQGPGWKSMPVTATAYCSYPDQTSGHPFLGARGDKLVPGMKAIAVSNNLIALGLRHETVVHIQGLEGAYRVLDKMNSEWRDRIDIYYGLNEQGALDWGKREIRIYWRDPE